jgi:hypothetical protein
MAKKDSKKLVEDKPKHDYKKLFFEEKVAHNNTLIDAAGYLREIAKLQEILAERNRDDYLKLLQE